MTIGKLASEELVELVNAERLKQLSDPAFAARPKDDQLVLANRIVMARLPQLARAWQVECDDLARFGSREKLQMARSAVE